MMGRLAQRGCCATRLLVLAASVGACTGSLSPVGPATDGPAYHYDGPKDGGAAQDRALPVDAPATPGEPCPAGMCGGDNICVAGLCRKMCTQPMAGCNDTAPECPPDHACLEATSFTDACFFASGQTGDACGDNGTTCLPTNVCVQVNTGMPRCLKLCEYGCAGKCIETTSGCPVCLE